MDKFELSMDLGSVHKWTEVEAIRDFIQNWLDNPNHSEWSYEEDTLVLVNRDTVLDRKVFLHGNSTKQDDKAARGCHGDGLKSGICVLLREGLDVTIYNGGVIWKPVVEYSETFETDVIFIHESEHEDWTNNDFSVKIKGVKDGLFSDVTKNTLALQPEITNKYVTKYGDILLDEQHKGRVYCGGLFVGNFGKINEGFDFKPEHLPLDRDRRALDPFEVRWKTKEMWSEIGSTATDEIAKYIAEGLDSGNSGMEYLHHASDSKPNKKVTEAVIDVYKEKYDGKILAESYEEKQELEASGYSNVEFIGKESFVKIVKQSDEYKTVHQNVKKVKPMDLLEDWKQEWCDRFDLDMLDSFEDLLIKLGKII